MPAKPKKGGGNRKAAKKGGHAQTSRDLVLAEGELQHYGIASQVLGSGRFRVVSYNDGKTYLGIIRGSMHKRAFVNLGDTVLIALRSFQDDKVDICGVYTAEEVKRLRQMEQIPRESDAIALGLTVGTGGSNVASSVDDVFDFASI